MNRPTDGSTPRANPPGAPASPAAPTRRAMTRPSRSWFERGVIALGVVGITTSLMGAGVMAWGLDKYEAIGSVEIGSVEAAEVGEPSNWLLVGTDSREGIDPNDPGAGVFLGEGAPEGKRTDTMIVARVDPTTGRIDLLSIPRDLYVPLDGGGEGRVNSAFNGEGGEERLVNTIESYFGIEINHYAEVNFVGFQDIVEGLGGVPIWFDYPMRDAGSGLNVPNAGCQVLDGFQSLAFVRGRHVEYFQDGSWHSDGTGDLGRSSRQQYFIRRVADTTLQKINIAEIGTLNNVLNIAGANLTIDGGAEIGSLLALAKAFGGVSGDQIVGHSLPVYDFRTSAGAAVLGLERELAEPTLAIFRGEEPTEVTAAPVPVIYRVENGSRIPGQASEAAKALSALGMNVETIDNGPTSERTVVRYPSSMAAGAAKLGSYLISGPAYEIDETLTEVVLLTGTDYQGLLETPRESVELPTPPTTAPVEVAPVETTTTTAVGVVPGPTPEGTACG
ncbi:MAG: LCP family protein [Acidimicrobiales bacterium]